MRRLSLSLVCLTVCFALLAVGCGGSSGSNSNTSSSQSTNGTMNAIVSDGASQDWATIGVKVLSITLTPQNGGTPVTIYTASSPAPFVNLVQLDQLGEIIGNASIPPGTYSQATLTVSGNPSDILLTSAPDPEPGFPLQTPTTVQSSQIQVVNAQGSTGNLTVPLTINLSPALTVTSNSSNALDLEFDLANPAFIVEHVPASGGTIWAVNFSPAVRHHPIRDITQLVLRHLYGAVTGVSSDNSYFTLDKIFLGVPASSTNYVTSTQSLQILADSGNVNGNGGTIFWNLDASPAARSVISNFSSVAGILTQPNEFVRVQARYQQNGTLVAVRVWASTSFSKVFVSPEGHVLDVDRTASPDPTFTIVTESGAPSNPISVSSNTEFLFNGAAIATGTAFLTANVDFVRGFKVHVNPVDPTATPLVADTVNIEIARFGGSISGANPTGFVYTRTFDAPYTGDNYTTALDYISSSTPNGEDDKGNAINGFKWWYFAQPTSTLQSGSGAITQFVSAVGGAVNYGASCTPTGFTAALTAQQQQVVGESYANWNDPANLNNAWSAFWTVLLPTPAPLSTVTTVPSGSGASFSITPVGTGCSAVTVDLDITSGQATLAYQVNRSAAGVITITPVGDISQPSTLAALDAALVLNTPVKVYGVPESNGHLGAYVLFYFTGTPPTS